MDVNFICQPFMFINNVTLKQLAHVFFMILEVNLPAVSIEMGLLRQRVNTVTSSLDITKETPFTGFTNLHIYQQYIRVPENTLPVEFVFKVFDFCLSNM